MKLYHLASLLMAAQVISSPMPQGWNAPPAGWSSPPTGWSPAPAGWSAAPPPVAVPDDGIVAQAAETLIGSDILITNIMGDNISLSIDDDAGNAAMSVASDLDPDMELGVYVGAAEIDNVGIADSGPTIYTYSYGADTNTVSLTSVYNGSISTQPQANAGATVGDVVASSWVIASDGVGVANTGSGGSGWKQDEGVKQN